jgi:alkylated DNA nucleotide flippase Atl1
MLISTPLEVQQVVRGIRKGRVLTMGELRARLAAQHNADYTCPLTTGIFLRIVAEAAEEERSAGMVRVSPWWRVVRDDGTLNDRLPGGGVDQARRLTADGVQVERAGATGWRLAGTECLAR